MEARNASIGRRAVALVVAAVAPLAATVLTASLAGGGVLTEYQMSMIPTAGDPGTSVDFMSITPCVDGTVVNLGTMPNPTGADILASGPVSRSGDWALTYVIPNGTPPGPIDFYVTCDADASGTTTTSAAGTSIVVFSAPNAVGASSVYGPATFTVTAPSTTSSSTTTISTSTTVSTTVPSSTTSTLVGPSVKLSASSVPQGGQVTVTSTGWKPGSTVQITLNSEPLDVGTAIADQVGTIVHTFTVPSNFLVGAHTVTLTGLDLAGQVQVLSADLEVTALAGAVNSFTPTGGSATGPLPRTGSSLVVPLSLVGAGVAVSGAGLVVASRRRR